MAGVDARRRARQSRRCETDVRQQTGLQSTLRAATRVRGHLLAGIPAVAAASEHHQGARHRGWWLRHLCVGQMALRRGGQGGAQL